MARILVVEDERKVLLALRYGLEQEGYEVATADNGDDGLRLAAGQPFDCVVLDLMLPGLDGLQVLGRMRRAGKATPVLILTARDAIEDRVAGLDAGADDYQVKPPSVPELLARVRALLRRGQPDRATVLRLADLEMDLLARRVTRAGAEVELTPREFEVLEYLLRNQGRVVTRDMLGRDVWKEPGHALTNVIEVYVNLLRRKVERPGLRPLIHTVRGLGYTLREEPP